MDKHIWELQGIGKSPFKVVGVFSIPSRSLLESNPAAYQSEMSLRPTGYPIGSCSVCGIGLTHNYLIQDANQQKLVVGCECVKKSGDHQLMSEVDYLVKKSQKEARIKKRIARHEAELNRQRSQCHGYTEEEWVEHCYQQQEVPRLEFNRLLAEQHLSDLIRALRKTPGNFAQGLLDILDKGNQIPTDSMFSIGADICSKHIAIETSGKTRGKTFNKHKQTHRSQISQSIKFYQNQFQHWKVLDLSTK